MKNKDLNSRAIPFFARYLEGQMSIEDVSESDAEAVKGGCRGPIETEKYPSDAEDDFAVTMKFPSDAEDDFAVTMKFPSDTDDEI